jgi:transcriptional regulator with XRE-family HTH domain
MVDTDKEILQSILDKENWKQVDFCRSTKIDSSTVSKIYQGKRNFPQKELKKLKQQFPYANIQIELKPPAWLEKDFGLLADNVNRIPEYAIRQLRERIKATLDLYAPDRPKDKGDNIFLDWGFFTSDLLSSLQNLFNGVFIYDSILVSRIENPFDVTSKYLVSTAGRGPLNRRIVKALYDHNQHNYMKEKFIWNRGDESSWSIPNPWHESLMVIPILFPNGRGVVVGIDSGTAVFTNDDLNLAHAHIKHFFAQRDIEIIEDSDLPEFEPKVRCFDCLLPHDKEDFYGLLNGNL